MRIRALRLERKTTQEALGKDLGVAKQTVNAWEVTDKVPQLDRLCLLADYFDVSVDYLLGRTDNPETNR